MYVAGMTLGHFPLKIFLNIYLYERDLDLLMTSKIGGLQIRLTLDTFDLRYVYVNSAVCGRGLSC